MRGVWCQALSLSRPCVLWAGQPGFRDPCVLGGPCEPLLRAVGVAEGRPRGGCLSLLRGASEFRRSPSSGCPLPTWSRGPLPTCCGRECADPGPQHCLLGLRALWGLRAPGLVGGRPRGGWPATL